VRDRRPAPSPRAPDPGAKPRPSVQAIAVRLLARRDYGRAELGQRLLRRGADRDQVEHALDELERLGYLSDARFAHGVVAQKAGRFAKRAIAHELKQKGVQGVAVAEALAALDGHDEVADALALWRRRFGKAPCDEREKARQIRFLLSRGYNAAVAFKVLRAMGAPVEGDLDPG
jgi:regulatory protein